MAGVTDHATLCDLNVDGMDDLVLGDWYGFAVALATGGGSFGPYQHFFPELGTTAVRHGDFDGDGFLDIAGPTESGVFVAYGSGTGSFVDVFQLAYPQMDHWSATGDLNGDGRTDLVVGLNSDSLVLAFVAGPGRTLVLADSCDIQGPIEGIVMGDVVGSPAADVVVTTFEQGFISIFPGNGDGTFGAPLAVPADEYATGIAIAPLDGSGANDLVVQQISTGAAFSSNLGGGLFTPFVSLPSPDSGWDLLVGDYDRNGDLDVLTGAITSGRTGFHTWSGDGAGGFGPRKDSGSTWRYRYNLVQGDIDGDGNLDVGGFFNSSYEFVVSRGNGDGTFGGPPSPASIVGRLGGGTAGDFDGDGKVDVVGANELTKKLAFARGRGDGTFDAFVESAALPLAYGYLVSGRFDADGALDIVAVQVSPPTLSFLHGNGNGTFAPPLDFTLGTTPTLPLLIDLEGDGRLDVVVPCTGANALYVLHQGVAGLLAPVTSATPAGPVAVRYADLNGDGRLDRALACSGLVSVQLDDGAGGWTTSLSVPRSPSPADVELADLDEDGLEDLVFNEAPVPNTSYPTLHFMRGHANGTFGADEPFSTDWDPGATNLNANRALGRVRAIDLDEDGHLDLVGLDARLPQVIVLRGVGDGAFGRPESSIAAWMRRFTDFGDFNGDGHVDMVTGGSAGQSPFLTSIGVLLNRTGGVVGVPPSASPRVAGLTIAAPFPNPARSSFTLRFRVPSRQAVTVDVVSVAGRRVLSRRIAPTTAGDQSLRLDGLQGLSAGVYAVVVSQSEHRASTRLVVLP